MGQPDTATTATDERDRLAALDFLTALDAVAGPAFDAVAQMAASVCETPIALIGVGAGERHWLTSSFGLRRGVDVPRGDSLCQHVIAHRAALVVSDTSIDQRFQTNPLVTSDPKVRFFTGLPLLTDEGYCIGTLCVMDTRPRRLTDGQRTSLERMASLVMYLLLARKQDRRLTRMSRMLGSPERTRTDASQPHAGAEPAMAPRAAEVQAPEDALFEQRELMKATLETVGDAVIGTDSQEHVAFLNANAETMTGWSTAQAAGRPVSQVFQLVDTATRQPVATPLETALTDDRRVAAFGSTLVGRHGREADIESSAAPIHDRLGRVTGGVLAFREVGEARAMALHMTRLAQHDFLTGLPNRVLLLDRVAQAIVQAQRSQRQVAVLFVDLDRFKHVNDSLGHEAGDQLLKEIASRLKACVRASDTVCRQGGDEFVVLLPEAPSVSDVAHVSEKLLDACRQRYTIDGHDVYVGASIGISLFPDDGDDVDALTRNADAAMYHAKAIGRNNFQFYTPDMNARARQRLALENGLRRALEQDELVLHYQPIWHLATGQVIGCEALLRWQEPGRGLLAPADFLPLLEDSALMVPISQWALREACRQCKAWQAAGLRPIPVAVNLSGALFKRKDFLVSVAETLRQTGLDPQYLELELTESIVMSDAAGTVTVLKSLKELGVRISIDDFGTGYSSLSQLRRFPIDTLKIDQSFVRDLATGQDDAAAITSAIISMAKSLRHRVVAEGVENNAQLEFLQTRGCDAMQGYFYQPPLSAAALATLLG